MTAPITSAARRTVEAFSVSHAAILDGTTAATETDIFGVRTASITPDLGQFDNTGDDGVLSTWNWFNFGNFQVESGFIGLDLYAKLSGTTVSVGGTPTAASLTFTPAATGGGASGSAYDYSGTAAVSFTIDGTTITLNSDLTNLAGVVAAVDAALSSTYTVTSSAGQVKVALTAPGTGAIVVAGAGAAAVTGSAGYSNTAGANASELSVPLWQEDCGNQPPRPVLIRMPSRDGLGNSLNLDVVLYKVQIGPISFQGPAYKTGLTGSYSGKILQSGFDETGRALTKKACGRLISRSVA